MFVLQSIRSPHPLTEHDLHAGRQSWLREWQLPIAALSRRASDLTNKSLKSIHVFDDTAVLWGRSVKLNAWLASLDVESEHGLRPYGAGCT